MPGRQSRFAAASSNDSSCEAAVRHCISAISSQISDPNIVVFFASEHEPMEFESIADLLRRAFPGVNVLGCNCQGTICESKEFESARSLVVWAARLEDVELSCFHLHYQRTPEGGAFSGTKSPFDSQPLGVEHASLIALADPFTFPMDVFLDRMREDHPGLPILGGMASGGQSPGKTQLAINSDVVNHGAVFLLLKNERTDNRSRFATVVSQGCRPIGQTMVVTAAERNEIFKLAGLPAIEKLAGVFRELPAGEQRLLQQALHLGIAIDEYRDRFGYGDFLIRNVVGLNQENASLVVGDHVRVGQTVQFHLRDHLSASAELRKLLQQQTSSHLPFSPKAGLVFSCNGRGCNLFPEPHHDAESIQKHAGQIALAGFFAAGEIGPVGGVNFVHGYTASLLLFFE